MAVNYPFNPGAWTRTITTSSPQAQLWFDRGLNWTYAYNQEEAVSCFRRALEHDPACAMAHWGIAYANGPFYNRPWIRYTDTEIKSTLPQCHAAAMQAVANAHGCAPAEQSLIHAVAYRYQKEVSLDRNELNRWHGEFVEQMREAHARHPDDLDVAALFVEAAVTRTPRQLWDLQTGLPREDSDIVEASDVLERSLARCKERDVLHPGLLHMHVHALEMSPWPEKALESADSLRDIACDAGHLHHMPAHIYVLVGDYAQAVCQSRQAIAADDLYRNHVGAKNFYTTARCHDLHLLMFAAMFLGQFGSAIYAANRIDEEATNELIEWAPPFMSSILDGYSAMRIHVLVRFGKWRELTELRTLPDPTVTPIRAAMHAYGQTVAYAAMKEFAQAEISQQRFHEVLSGISPKAVFLSNPIRNMLAVGEAMMEGELAYHRGKHERGLEFLRLATSRDDSLNYTEPWAWMHPPRHALGALLAEQEQFEEAEQVYREDLGMVPGVPRCIQHPNNIWALHGLLECLERRGDDEALTVRQDLSLAQQHADHSIKSACYCRGL